MSKKITIGHGPILETAKRIVERTVFYKNVKCLLSDCFIHIYRIVHLLRREVQQEQVQTHLKIRQI